MAYDVRAIANFVIDEAQARGRKLTNLDINKLVYFLHAWHLGRFNIPLVRAKIEAWTHGPVFRELYSQFKRYGSGPVTEKAQRLNKVTGSCEVCQDRIDEATKDFLRKVLDSHLKFGSYHLVMLSHEGGGPWDVVFNHAGVANPGMRISDEIIQAHFAEKTRH